MKKRFFAFALATLFILSALALTACSKDEDEIVTEVRFTSYDNGDGDMISFYMTSDTEPYGVWGYDIQNQQIFEIIMDEETTNDYGWLGWGGTASYRTLILKPISEGEATVSFALSDSDMTYEYTVKVTKDGDYFRIEAKKA